MLDHEGEKKRYPSHVLGVRDRTTSDVISGEMYRIVLFASDLAEHRAYRGDLEE
jgi:hypothetical protein